MINFGAYDKTQYTPVSDSQKTAAYATASYVSGAILLPLMWCGKPFEKQLKEELLNNQQYKDAFFKSLEISGLKDKGVSFVDARNVIGLNSSYVNGTNACFRPADKKVILNADKIAVSGFHELGHAMNSTMGKLTKYSKKLIPIGLSVSALMGYIALFNNNHPKDEEKTSLAFKVRDNAGKIAFLGFVPLLIEEAMASIKGIKLAKMSGLSKSLIPNLKNIYAKAFFTYFAKAALTALSVGAANIIMEKYTRPQRSKNDFDLFNF